MFKIVEAPLNIFFVELWGMWCIMMFRWTNKQSGIQKFWNLCGHYQDIYDWINGQAYHFILTQRSMERMSKINPGTCLFSLLWSKPLMVLSRCNFFSWFHSYTSSKTLIACRDMQLRFEFKFEFIFFCICIHKHITTNERYNFKIISLRVTAKLNQFIVDMIKNMTYPFDIIFLLTESRRWTVTISGAWGCDRLV